MGGVFRMPVVEDVTTEQLRSFLKENGYIVYLADMRGENMLGLNSFPDRTAIIIGGEAEGAGSFTSGIENSRIAIPMVSGAESLNASVAAGILIYQVLTRLGGRRAN
jgi:TrmH family RNA methyltransferase